jgi:hypothetical protein
MIGAILGGAQMIGGAIQAIAGSKKARRAENALENLQTPTTTNDAAVNSYYQTANANPYDTSAYRMQSQNAGRSLATGAAILGARGGNSSAIQGLVRGYNDQLLKAGMMAEQQQKQMLGQATRMKSMDNQRLFEVNKLMPYQKKFSLLGAKASAGNQIANAGWKNMMGGAQTAALGAGGGGLGGLFGGGGSNSGVPSTDLPYSQPIGLDHSYMSYNSPAALR